ncbi:MAG: GNAT family N-acetyltransferase [Planctomycetes bacterium]|nr:GNAT family N-acetyltransferase [Planctomycetota bacterium]MBI3846378.1 GNAT family N-acetyltransferase [Planctomycetota bacterium]
MSRKPATYRVRDARAKDAAAFLGLVEALADFEKLDPPDAAARRRLRRDAFGVRPRIHVLLAETSRGEAAAYAIYFFTYSSFLAKPTLYLEDLFVHPDHRRRRVADLVMRRLAAIAKREGCGRMEWVVLDWNKGAQAFYERLGARHLHDWFTYRLDHRGIARLSK